MGSIVAGVVLIAIGLFMDSSIFYGDFTLFNIIFDGLGVYFIGKGAMEMSGQSAKE
jgi:hypothetical protein